MSVITVSGTAVATYEIISIAITIPVFSTYIILGHCFNQRLQISNINPVRVTTVILHPGNICAIDGNWHQSSTSFDSSSNTLVINFKAFMMVESSVSPPKTTSSSSVWPKQSVTVLTLISVLARSLRSEERRVGKEC